MRYSALCFNLLIGLAALAPATGLAQKPTNVLLNSSAEEGQGNQPSHWFAACVPADGLRMERTTGAFHSGKHSLGIVNEHRYDQPVSNNWAQEIADVPGKQWVRLDGWIRTEGAEAVNLCVQCWDAQNHMVAFASTPVLRGDNDWVRLQGKPVLVPPETKSLIIRAALTGRGKAWFDDLVLTIVDDPSPPARSARWTEDAPTSPGVAVLASSLGKEVSHEEVVALVKACRINPLVIDFAWITHHWPNTDPAAVERLARELGKEGVVVAAMYRPRGLSPKDAKVHWAQEADGTIPDDHNHLCFAHADSVEWGADWGKKILTACPSIQLVVLYNVTSHCQCKQCAGGNGAKHAEAFVQACGRQWRTIRPTVKIGHVGMGREYTGSVDLLCPFFVLNREGKTGSIDTRALALQARSLQQTSGKPVLPLIKVCWVDETRNDTADILHAIRDCQREGIGFILWYYEWLFHSEDHRYDPSLVLAALGGHPDQMHRFYEAKPATGDKRPSNPGCPSRKTTAGELPNHDLPSKSRGASFRPPQAEEENTKVKSLDARYHWVSPYEGFPSASAKALRLECIRREAALVYHSPTKRQLAVEVADVLEKMHAEARRITAFPISVHGLVLLESEDELPSDKRAHWLNVDRVACLVHTCDESKLPLQGDLANHMVFAMLIHESVDIGIKETIFVKYPQTMDWRWWLEGLADYCSHEACRKHQRGAFAFARNGYKDKLAALKLPSVNLLAEKTWFPEGYTGPDDVNHAYAASQYVTASLVQRHGEAWIGKALRQYRQELGTKDSPDFLAIVKSLTGEDASSLVKNVNVDQVKRFVDSLDGSPAQRR